MEDERKQDILQDNDFKYVMLDAGSVYLGARLTFEEILAHDMVPFKLKAILNHYILKEVDAENTLESQFYYLEHGDFLYETLNQLKIRVKVSVLVEKKTMFGKIKHCYAEKVLSLKELTGMNLAKKKASGMIVREIIISKLALMAFNV